jgi:hypothetical protein
MKRTLIAALLVMSLSAPPAMAGPTLKQQLAAVKAKVAKLQAQLKQAKSAAKAQHHKDAVKIADAVQLQTLLLTEGGKKDIQISTLTTQVQKQFSDAVSAILSGTTDQIYSNVQQIWNAFPLRPSGQTCGYDKSANVVIDFPILKSSTYTFSYVPC